jgi:biotin-[acetyl-CoA-carboxylase] ligase BirA-like protein
MNKLRWQNFVYPELDSTNEEAKRLLAQGSLPALSLIRAHTQTAGKGTQGRQWISPPGAGLYFSIVHSFDTDVEPTPAEQNTLTPLLTLAAGVACAETIQELTGLQIQLKPINDLYVDGCKLGGILTESIISRNRCRALITGIGINIYSNESVDAGCQSDERGNRPTSLQACIAPVIFNQWQGDTMMQEISEAVTQRVDAYYQQFFRQGHAEILEAYLRFKIPACELPAEIANVVHAAFPGDDSSTGYGG